MGADHTLARKRPPSVASPPAAGDSFGATVPHEGSAAASPRVHTRVRRGMGRRANWLQLIKFCLVGGSGYVVNLAVFTVAVSVLDLHHLVAATIAFAVAVANNFWWNRHWTFDARGGRARFQAPRFFAVSIVAFGAQVAMLELLIVGAGAPEVVAQAVSVIAATPLNFVGNKMWSFAAPRTAA